MCLQVEALCVATKMSETETKEMVEAMNAARNGDIMQGAKLLTLVTKLKSLDSAAVWNLLKSYATG